MRKRKPEPIEWDIRTRRTVKEKSNDIYPDASDINIFYSGESSEVNNFETFPFYQSSVDHANEVMASQENFGKSFMH
uniref:Uncharacterized protein n=1 Tax=Trichogramma kaykai TaxID=54128 RepID=A0ABD2X5B0_9HYME